MARDLTIHLVRHGQSEANLDKTIGRTVPDHAVALSPEGKAQARAAGLDFAARYADGLPAGLAVYVSPYLRTRETWAAMGKAMADVHGCDAVAGLRTTESIFLRELEFGLFDGYPDEELADAFPLEYAHYDKAMRFAGEFYARMPSGESRCDVAQRVSQFFGTLHRDAERHGVTDAIVVSHGVTIRAFAMQWLGRTVEWYGGERNPRNCSVRTLVGDQDRGYTYAGFDHARGARAQDAREDADVGG